MNCYFNYSAILIWGSKVIVLVITIPISQMKKWRPKELKIFPNIAHWESLPRRSPAYPLHSRFFPTLSLHFMQAFNP
jgi:hypothetical protein